VTFRPWISLIGLFFILVGYLMSGREVIGTLNGVAAIRPIVAREAPHSSVRSGSGAAFGRESTFASDV
jgi:hypothetical protein